LAAGTYRTIVSYRDIVSGGTVAVPGAAPTFDVELVVRKLGDVDAIRGVVVDESGNPVSGAFGTRFGGAVPQADTDEHGAFVVTRPLGGAGSEAMVLVGKSGYEATRMRSAWGERDLRCTLRAHGTAAIELLVKGSDGHPVTGYRVWNLASELPGP